MKSYCLIVPALLMRSGTCGSYYHGENSIWQNKT